MRDVAAGKRREITRDHARSHEITRDHRCVTLLLSNGATTAVEDWCHGERPQIQVEISPLGELEWSPANLERSYRPLHAACGRGLEGSVALLLEKGANANAPMCGINLTPLHVAAAAARPAVVRLLIAARADPAAVCRCEPRGAREKAAAGAKRFGEGGGGGFGAEPPAGLFSVMEWALCARRLRVHGRRHAAAAAEEEEEEGDDDDDAAEANALIDTLTQLIHAGAPVSVPRAPNGRSRNSYMRVQVDGREGYTHTHIDIPIPHVSV